ncbi:3-isopropylmalate dehydrogenase [Rubrivirga sp. IMCC43871]|uniref:3-isopropylmalate dehydrogenase n=1 Tax=Rubrivirga sp. IMCC43871 TaxID=3391575 RepID=UPI00398F8E68
MISPPRPYSLALLPGDGIGPEVSAEAVRVLEAAGEVSGFAFETTEHAVGGAGIDACGDPLPRATLDACLLADAVFLGAVGGPDWDAVPPETRPERGLLRLRARLGAFANLRPVVVSDALAERSPLRPERVAGTDLLIVRELTGGIYFGLPRDRTATEAYDTMRYAVAEVERIARVAFDWAEKRSGRVTSVDKANVLASSALWRDVVSRVGADEFPDVALEHLYVDHAAMEVVRDPRRFDVVVTGNLFGDVLSDLAATLPGTLGLLPSASLGGRAGLFEPVHGSAPDLAGRNVANPLAAILSAAMLLDALGEGAAADAVRAAVEAVVTDGPLTPDLGGTASTPTVGAAVADAVSSLTLT